MLDLKLLRDRPEEVRQALSKRGAVADLDRILELDGKRRQLETRRVALQAESNSLGKKVGELIRQGADPQGAEVTALRQQGADLKAEIAQLEQRERELEEEIRTLLLTLPNLPLPSVPVGQDETGNVEVRRWGDALKPTHPVLPHDEIAEKLGLLEVGRAVKVAQSRFVAMVGAGAALERALIAMMLERHIAAGYTEVIPPFLVNSAALRGDRATAQVCTQRAFAVPRTNSG